MVFCSFCFCFVLLGTVLGIESRAFALSYIPNSFVVFEPLPHKVTQAGLEHAVVLCQPFRVLGLQAGPLCPALLVVFTGVF